MLQKISLFLILFFGSNHLLAQKDFVEKVFAFKITGYIKPLTDSSTVVQVFNPASFPVLVSDKQWGVLYHCYKNGTMPDTGGIPTVAEN